MERAPADRLLVQRNVITGLLLALAAMSWALLAWHGAREVDMPIASPTMGMRAPLFLAIWVVMMCAMMFPAAAPMILTFHKVQASKRDRNQTFVATWVAAGLYQLTPLKDRCLSKCRTPIGFIMTSWRDGVAGALRMGLLHGAYCLGCCWLLFVILFPLGVMNVAAMGAITLVIFAEKTSPWGRPVARATAAALVVYGAVVLIVPRVLPTFMPSGSIAMAAPAAPMDMQTMPVSGSTSAGQH